MSEGKPTYDFTPSKWPTHDQKAPSPHLLLFHPPHPDIGEVVSADSTLRTVDAPREGEDGFTIGMSAGMLSFGIMLILGHDPGTALLGATLIGIITSTWTGFLPQRAAYRHYCSYIGTEGIAVYTMIRRDKTSVTEEVVYFPRAEALMAQSSGGRRRGLKWIDKKDDELLAVEMPSSLSRSQQRYWAATLYGAEKAWTHHYMSRIVDRLRKWEVASFPLGEREIHIGIGHLQINTSEKLRVYSKPALMETFQVRGDVVVFDGDHSVPISQFPNYSVFCYLLEQMLELRLG